MTDNEVWQILTTTFNQAILDGDLGSTIFARSQQPRQQGSISGPALYCFRISSLRDNWQHRKDVYNNADGDFDHTEEVWLTSTYQVSAEVSENPEDINQLTAFDIVSRVSFQLNTLSVRNALLAEGISIYTITDIRTPYFKNESDRFEADPSFDFTISYKQTNISKVTAVTEIKHNINRV